VSVIVVTVVVVRIRRMGVSAMRAVVMLDLVAARVPRMGANDRDRSRNEGADQRQKNDCLDHALAPLRMTSAQTRSAFVARENRFPLFRIMRLTLHQIDVFNRDRTTVAEVDHEHG
jgi:hypothetical protein